MLERLSAKRWLVVIGLGAAAILGGTLLWQHTIGNPYGSYFRLKVALTYKQQPVGFDIVVGCNVRFGHILGGGTSVDTMGMSAFVFAKAIPDGHAISVRTLPQDNLEPTKRSAHSPCLGGTTANGEIPADWLPVIVWYDRAGDLSHGRAYATRRAYDSPSAQLTFGGTVVEPATASDYRRFLRSGSSNLLPSYLATSLLAPTRPFLRTAKDLTPEMIEHPASAWPLTGWLTCRGMRRWRVPPELAQEVQNQRPPGAERLWSADAAFAKRVLRLLEGGLREARTKNAGREAARKPQPDLEPIILPSTRDDGLSQLTPTTFANERFYEDTTTTDAEASAGFMFCDRQTPPSLFEAVTGRRVEPADSTRVVCRMDGQVVRVDAYCSSKEYVVFDNDEYIYSPFDTFMD